MITAAPWQRRQMQHSAYYLYGQAVACAASSLVFVVHAAAATAQVRAVISTFGQLKAFSLLRDTAGQSTGAALAEFQDPGVLNGAIAGLSVLTLGPERLTVSRAANHEHVVALQQLIQQQQAALMQRLTGRPVPGADAVLALPAVAPPPAAAASLPQPPPEAFPPPPEEAPPAPAAADVAAASTAAAAGAGVGPSGEVARQSSMAHADSVSGGLCVVRLEHMVTRAELLDEEEYEDILDDTREEVAKYGPLKQVRGGQVPGGQLPVTSRSQDPASGWEGAAYGDVCVVGSVPVVASVHACGTVCLHQLAAMCMVADAGGHPQTQQQRTCTGPTGCWPGVFGV